MSIPQMSFLSHIGRRYAAEKDGYIGELVFRVELVLYLSSSIVCRRPVVQLAW